MLERSEIGVRAALLARFRFRIHSVLKSWRQIDTEGILRDLRSKRVPFAYCR